MSTAAALLGFLRSDLEVCLLVTGSLEVLGCLNLTRPLEETLCLLEVSVGSLLPCEGAAAGSVGRVSSCTGKEEEKASPCVVVCLFCL